MEYYVILKSRDKKIIGHYPQTVGVKHNCNVWNEPRFIENIDFQKVDFEPITSNAILHKSANLTDLINIPSIGFTKKLLVSDKLKNILQGNSLELQFFKSGVYFKDKLIEDYWIFNSCKTNMEHIDYNKSQIYLFNLLEKTQEIKL